jgi:hypothetical protein
MEYETNHGLHTRSYGVRPYRLAVAVLKALAIAEALAFSVATAVVVTCRRPMREP